MELGEIPSDCRNHINRNRISKDGLQTRCSGSTVEREGSEPSQASQIDQTHGIREPISLAIFEASQHAPVAQPAHLWADRRAADLRHPCLIAIIKTPPRTGIVAIKPK